MGHRSTLLTRWSRRDRLAIVVVAVTVAFLTGATLVGIGVGSSTTAIATDYDSSAAVEWQPGVAQSGGEEAVQLPVAEVRVNGTETLAIGVPPNSSLGTVSLPDRTSWGGVTSTRTVTLSGSSGTVEIQVAPRGESVVPSHWVVVPTRTVNQLGRDATVTATPATGVPDSGVPLRGVLAFFLAGVREVLAALAVVGLLGAVLAGVTVFATTRTTVRDRASTIAVLRATGATPRAIASLFAARALLQVAVGVAAGYAGGVIITNVVVNAAVAAGVPASLSVEVTAQGARYLLGLYGLVLTVALVAALAAVRPAVTRPPAHVDDSRGRASLPGALAPTVLDARAVVPTAATLAAFVAFVLLVAGVGVVAAPLAGTDDTTITDSSSNHPIASDVPATYADALRARGIPASAEILLFEVRDGQPFPARGANFSAFASLTDASIVRGRPPAASDEIVVGTDLARTLGVDVGDRFLLGGSTQPAVTRVEVVGTFRAAGSTDDQAIVPLSTARHLSGSGAGTVQFIRAARLPASPSPDATAVADLRAPGTVLSNETFEVRVTVTNTGFESQQATRTVRFRGQTQRVDLSVPSTGQATATVTFRAPNVSRQETYRIRSRNVSTRVTVSPPGVITIVGLPPVAPPGSEPRVRVVDVRGQPVANASVHVGNRTVRTGRDGYTRLPLDTPGEHTVRAEMDGRTATGTVTVDPAASRNLSVATTLSPSAPSLYTRPALSVALANPWNVTLNRTVKVAAPGGPYVRQVGVAPGGSSTARWRLSRQSPGEYAVSVSLDGASRAGFTYRVTGDERVVAALATGGQQGSTGIGRAAQVAFGNLGIMLGALVVLGGLMAVGGTGATFAAAVHARRRTLGVNRAVGASPGWVLRTVLIDALRLGLVAVLPAVVVGIGILTGVDALGLLVVYGVRIPVVPSIPILVAAVAGALVVTLAGAGVAALGVARAVPAQLLLGDTRGVRTEERHE